MVIDSGDYKANDLYELSVRYFNLAATTSDATVKADAVAKARKYADDVNKLVPNNVRIVNQIAKIEKLAEGENHGKAAAAYKNLIALLDSKEDKASYADYYIYAYNYLATYAFNSGDKEGAKVYYRKWLENDPNNADLRKFVEQMK
jgi:Tfp pilus assembly protein PilF